MNTRLSLADIIAPSHWLTFRGGDVRELKRHIHANSVDRFTLRRFVTAVLGNREPDVKQEYQVTLSISLCLLYLLCECVIW